VTDVEPATPPETTESQASPPQAASRPAAASQDSEPQTILILAALGIPLIVTAPIAWYLGSRYVNRCEKEGRQPDSSAEVGRIMGMVVTILWGSLLGLYVLMMVVMVVLMVVFYGLFFLFMIVIMLAAAVAGV